MLCGAPPADSLSRAAQLASNGTDPLKPLREHNAHIPEHVEKVLLQTLAVAPEQRPASAVELRALLNQTGQMHTAAQSTTRPPLGRRPREILRRRPKSMALFGLLVLIPIIFLATIYQPQAPPTILIPRTVSASIKREGVNRLEVIGKGTHFWFFINGTYVSDVEDGALPQGKMNFVVRLPRADRAIFDFDSLEIRTPSK